MAELNKALNLPITSKFLRDLPETPKGYIGPREIAPSEEELRGRITQAEENVGKRDIEIEKAKRTEKVRELEAAATSAREFATGIEKMPEALALKERQEELNAAKFIPTQDTVQTLSGLFGLIGVIGMVVGKTNALLAMNAMNGMLEGHRKGRQDLFKKEQAEFEKNFKALQAKVSQAVNDYERAIKLKQVNREASEAEKAVALARMESPMLNQMEKKLGDVRVLNNLKDIKNSMDKAVALQNDLYSKAEQRQLQREQLQSQNIRSAQSRMQLMQGSDGQLYRVDPGTGQVRGVESPEGVKLTRLGTGGRGSALNDRYAFNINESFSQAATDLLNVSQMPGNTVLGTFAGMTGQSGDTLTKSLSNVLARKLTPEDQRLMQQIVAGLDQNMARALGGGYATSTSRGLIQAYKEQVAQMGDSPLAQAMFLSRMKQELGILAKAFKNHPGANEGYVNDMNEYMSALNKAIPFSVSDVISANRGKKITVTDKFANLTQTPSVVPLPRDNTAVSPAPSAAPKPMPTGEKLKAYAKEHFDGDEEKAKNYLKTQGYQ